MLEQPGNIQQNSAQLFIEYGSILTNLLIIVLLKIQMQGHLGGSVG